MTRSQANKIALELMKQHLEPGWFMNVGKVSLTMRGVQIKNAIADRLVATWRGVPDGAQGRREVVA